MSNNDKREIMEEMRMLGWFEYGAVIDADKFRAMFGIEYPETATKKEFDEVSLKELSCADFVRNQLLNEGKYLKGDGSSYRVLLPSENEIQVQQYMKAANTKLKRGIKLAQNTPRDVYENRHNDIIRARMKMEGAQCTMN